MFGALCMYISGYHMVLTLLRSNIGRFILHTRPPNGHFPVGKPTYLPIWRPDVWYRRKRNLRKKPCKTLYIECVFKRPLKYTANVYRELQFWNLHTLISIVIVFAGNLILQGFPKLDVGKPCNNLIFWDIHAKDAGITCKL